MGAMPASVLLLLMALWLQPTQGVANLDTCGLTKPELKPQSQKGLTNTCDYPWMVLVRHGQSSVLCSGALIDATIIVTEVQCLFVNVRGSKMQVPAANLSIYFKRASFNLDDLSSPDALVRRVIIHPKFNDTANDIALLKLTHPVTFSTCLKPICMIDSTKTAHKARNCLAMGYGSYISNKSAETGQHYHLHSFFVRVSTDWACSNEYHFLKRSSFCTDPNKAPLTATDRGGPLACRESDGRFYVYGLLSSPRNDSSRCGQALNLYTNVSRYIKWINYQKREEQHRAAQCGKFPKHGVSRHPSKCPYRWMVRVYNSLTLSACTGVILDARHVLTSALCLYRYDPLTEQLVNASAGDIAVVSGSEVHKLDQVHQDFLRGRLWTRKTFPRIRTVSQVVLIPVVNFDNDIAILKLKSNISFDSCHRPICKIDSQHQKLQNCSVVGWTQIPTGSNGEYRLRQITVPEGALSTCRSQVDNLGKFNPNSKFCAGNMTEKACQFEYGGVFMCRARGRRYMLYGLVAAQSRVTCHYEIGLFTNSSHYWPWITQVTKTAIT